MNELAAAAAVAPMSVDDGAEADPDLEDTPGAAAANDVPMPAFEAADADKEDDGDFPGTREQRAEARNVQLCPRSQECQAQSQPNTLSCHPIAQPARVPMQCTAAGCSSCELPSSRLCVTRPLGSPTPWEGGSRGASAATSAAAASSAVEASLDPDGAPTPAEQVGRIFVEFEDAEAAAECARSMDGRFFDGRRVTASFYPRRRLALWSRVRRAKSKTRLLFCRRRLRGYRSSA